MPDPGNVDYKKRVLIYCPQAICTRSRSGKYSIKLDPEGFWYTTKLLSAYSAWKAAHKKLGIPYD